VSRAGFELRVKLGGKEEGVIGQFQALHTVFIDSRED
jgi:hypothetical protein